MSSIRGVLRAVAALGAEEQSVTVFGFATKDGPEAVLKPGYFQSDAKAFYDGDFLVTNHVPAKTALNPEPRGRKIVSIIHKDHRGHVSLTRLFELPHDPRELHAALADGLSSLVEPRYIPTYLEAEEQRKAERAAQTAEREAPAPAAPERRRGRLHLKQA